MKKTIRKTGTVRRILSYLEAYRWLFLLTLLLAALTVAATLLLPILIGDAIDLIVDKGQVDFRGLSPILTQALVLIAIGTLAWWLMNICNNKITYEIVRRVRTDAFHKIQTLPIPISIRTERAKRSARSFRTSSILPTVS